MFDECMWLSLSRQRREVGEAQVLDGFWRPPPRLASRHAEKTCPAAEVGRCRRLGMRPNTLDMMALLEMTEALGLSHLLTGQVGGPEADE